MPHMEAQSVTIKILAYRQAASTIAKGSSQIKPKFFF